MKYQITQDFRVTTDERNFTLEKRSIGKKGKSEGVEKWSSLGHYPTLDKSLAGYTRHAMLSSSANGIDEIKSLLQELTAVLDGVRKGLELSGVTK